MAFSACKAAAAASFLASLAALSSAANDTSSSVTAKGLVFLKNDSIAMKKERLEISPDRIRVRYEFRNESKAPIETDVSFPMPSQRSSAHSYHSSARLEDFSVKVDGKKKDFTTVTRATYADSESKSRTDITAELKSLNLPVDSFPDVAKLPPATLEKLKAENWVSEINPDGALDADWEIERVHTWKQAFPAGKIVRIEHEYAPVLGSNSIGTPQLAWDTVAEPGWAERSNELVRLDSNARWSAANLSYVLTTGNHWKDGIEDFELRITGAPVIFIAIGPRHDVGLDSVVWKKTGFKPEDELQVEFLRPRPAKKTKSTLSAPSIGPLGLTKVVDGPANCRDRPEKKAPVARTHEDGATVRLLERKGDWYRVTPDCWTYAGNLRNRLE